MLIILTGKNLVPRNMSANMPSSASPLNGEAAELWDKDMEEFKRKVLARHRDVDDD